MGGQYYEAVYLMKRYLQRLPVTGTFDEEPTRKLLQQKIGHYEKRASTLMADDSSTVTDPRSPIGYQATSFFQEDDSGDECRPNSHLHGPVSATETPRSTDSELINSRASQANTKLAHALDLDEAGKIAAATTAYMEAAELYLQTLQALEQCETSSSQNQSVKSLLIRRLERTLDRIEELKNPTPPRNGSSSDDDKSVVVQRHVREVNNGERDEASSISSSSSLTAEEIAVLKRSSLIASGMFLPWSDGDAIALSAQALQQQPPTVLLYTDPDGFLNLSAKQGKHLHQWARPSEIVRIRQKMGLSKTLQKPVLVQCITPYTIKQQYVSDCSFIASLCICAAFERRFQKRLITSILYPQTRHGTLLYNPAGKYMVKLWLNGVARCVVVDDFLPIDKYGNLLCSHTTTTTNTSQLELWVCLIEKAYMKLCGGYDFPGSNSGVDLFSLTGWIPERILFPKDPEHVRDHETDQERVWERIFSASSYGDCLITVSAQVEITEDEAKQVGLVTGHAYAVLSVIQTRDGTRLLQLKNPWGNMGWKGRYASGDATGWRDPAFRAQVGYDPELAAKEDDGVFWICWEDILRYFQNFHLSWNPNLFRYRTTTHGFWPKEQGPADDTFNVGDNPQYVLSLSNRAIERKATIWILLARHVTKQEQSGIEVRSSTIVRQC
jgi:calpain-7